MFHSGFVRKRSAKSCSARDQLLWPDTVYVKNPTRIQKSAYRTFNCWKVQHLCFTRTQSMNRYPSNACKHITREYSSHEPVRPAMRNSSGALPCENGMFLNHCCARKYLRPSRMSIVSVGFCSRYHTAKSAVLMILVIAH